jgi:hypothetical protein
MNDIYHWKGAFSISVIDPIVEQNKSVQCAQIEHEVYDGNDSENKEMFNLA